MQIQRAKGLLNSWKCRSSTYHALNLSLHT